jgi:hypothetical protein
MCPFAAVDVNAAVKSPACIHCLQEFLDAADGPAIRSDISGQRRNGLVEFAALHDVEDALLRGMKLRSTHLELSAIHIIFPEANIILRCGIKPEEI